MAVIVTILLGGLLHEMYINVQEYPTTYLDSLSDYMESYVSGFAMAGVEVGAGYYLFRSWGKLDAVGIWPELTVPFLAGIVGFMGYVLAEFLAGFSSEVFSVPTGYLLYYGLNPNSIDYSNAAVLGINLFGFVLLIKSMHRIAPFMHQKRLPKNSGMLASLWSTGITVASAVVCCGPLPGVIALVTGIPSLYFTSLINYQAFVAALGIPALLFAVFLADRRATKGCSIIQSPKPNSNTTESRAKLP